MKRLMLLLLVLFLFACGNDSSAFSFDDKSFTEKYEEITEKEKPSNVVFTDESINLVDGTTEDAIALISTLNQLSDDEQIREFGVSLINIDETYHEDELTTDDYYIKVNVDNESATVSIFPNKE